MANKSSDRVSVDGISTSWGALVDIIFLLITIFLVIWGFVLLIVPKAPIYLTIILFLCACFGLVKPCTGRVAMNQAIVLLNSFSKKSRAVFHGFYWKLPWEKVEYEIDLEANIEAKIDGETFPTESGTVVASTVILSKADSAEGEDEKTRSKYMITHVKNEPEAIKGMVIARAREVMRGYFKEKTLVEALASQGSEILKLKDLSKNPPVEGSFDELETRIRVSVKECPVTDIDPTKETQDALDARTKGNITKEVADEFMKLDPKLEAKDALNFATLMNKDISVEKKIHEFNVSGLNISPAVAGLFTKLATKLGGTKK